MSTETLHAVVLPSIAAVTATNFCAAPVGVRSLDDVVPPDINSGLVGHDGELNTKKKASEMIEIRVVEVLGG